MMNEIYKENTKLNDVTLMNLLKSEKFITSNTALSYGIIDEIF